MAVLVAAVLKAFVVQAFYIPSASMNDTLVLDDRILVEKVSYWGSGAPRRGDVIVFADPGGWLGRAQTAEPGPVARVLGAAGLYPAGGHLVKRVIGVAGDRVVCCDPQGRITVNGGPLDEQSYLAAGQPPSQVRFDVRVAPGRLWVQGDNRVASADSRAHLGDPGGGQVPVGEVVGRVVAVVWPLDHARRVATPPVVRAVR